MKPRDGGGDRRASRARFPHRPRLYRFAVPRCFFFCLHCCCAVSRVHTSIYNPDELIVELTADVFTRDWPMLVPTLCKQLGITMKVLNRPSVEEPQQPAQATLKCFWAQNYSTIITAERFLRGIS